MRVLGHVVPLPILLFKVLLGKELVPNSHWQLPQFLLRFVIIRIFEPALFLWWVIPCLGLLPQGLVFHLFHDVVLELQDLALSLLVLSQASEAVVLNFVRDDINFSFHAVRQGFLLGNGARLERWPHGNDTLAMIWRHREISEGDLFLRLGDLLGSVQVFLGCGTQLFKVLLASLSLSSGKRCALESYRLLRLDGLHLGWLIVLFIILGIISESINPFQGCVRCLVHSLLKVYKLLYGLDPSEFFFLGISCHSSCLSMKILYTSLRWLQAQLRSKG